MKKVLIATATLLFLALGTGTANAATVPPVDDIPFAVPVTVPFVVGGTCATDFTDISGTADITYQGDTVATYEMDATDTDFVVVVTIVAAMDRYYDIFDPRPPANVRASSITFLVPKCPPAVVEPPIVVAPPVVAPVVPVVPVVPVDDHVVAPAAPVAVVPVVAPPVAMAPVQVQSVPVSNVTPTVPAQLANTGVKETVAMYGLGALLLGAALIFLSRKFRTA